MRLIYVYDALCGWCYGFSKTLNEFVANHPELEQVEVISGGMVRGERVRPISSMADYISGAYRDVEQRTGIKFGKEFLEGTLKEGTKILNSIPPAIAMAIFKREIADEQLDFASAIQRAFYFDGKDIEDKQMYAELAANFGLDRDEFLSKMNDPIYRDHAEKEFMITQSWGINGFPSLILEAGGQLNLMAHGALPLEMLEENYKIVLQESGNG